MYVDNRDGYYYLGVYNENYPQPAMPAGVESGIVRGMYLLRSEDKAEKAHVQLLGSGCILREVIAAADLLKEEWRSEEHTSELQSLMRISYAVFCLKKKKQSQHIY